MGDTKKISADLDSAGRKGFFKQLFCCNAIITNGKDIKMTRMADFIQYCKLRTYRKLFFLHSDCFLLKKQGMNHKESH